MALGKFFAFGTSSTLTLEVLEVALTQTNRLGRDFHELVVVNEFNGGFKRELHRRNQTNRFVGTGSTNVRELLAANRIHDNAHR